MIKNQFPLDFQWATQEPFLFCVHHHDHYPRGTESFGPEKSFLQGRDMGQDFAPKDGFRMYHGKEVPGFPAHPHRGFETITIVRQGYVDHADSLGAAGRYGEGDVQWMTGGDGVQHSEMFPLLNRDNVNTLELFQIWLNLPRRSKAVPACFRMFWSPDIPQLDFDQQKVRLSLIAGKFEGQNALPPPPDSWAADPDNEVCILLIKINAGGKITLPASKTVTNRTLYFFDGDQLNINGVVIPASTGLEVDSNVDLVLSCPQSAGELLLLQAKPIDEPIVQHGPFVMNSRDEIIQTFDAYRRTQFGGWPWPRPDMVHGPTVEKFAKYPDGTIEKPHKPSS